MVNEEGWKAILIGIGYELEMRTNDKNYPINHKELLGDLRNLELEFNKYIKSHINENKKEGK